MELSILHAIQLIHNPFLDQVMVTVFNNLVGSIGQLWIVVGLILLVIPKTRKCGVAVLLSYAVSFLIVKKPGSFSCPSVHTYLAFSSAMAIYHYYKKMGMGVFVFAALVGFSRMYFFVHYPTNVLLGATLGIVTAFAVCTFWDKVYFYAGNFYKKRRTDK